MAAGNRINVALVLAHETRQAPSSVKPDSLSENQFATGVLLSNQHVEVITAMSDDLILPLRDVASRWGVIIEQVIESDYALLGFGTVDGDTVVLKVVSPRSNERDSGAVAATFGPNGMVAVLRYEPGAILMPRQVPGLQLAEMVSVDQLGTLDDILADVFRRLHYRQRRMPGAPTVEQWGRSFPLYMDQGHSALPRKVVEHAWRTYDLLCETQGPATILHGDLHHHNVLFDDEEGWNAIDPKGVIGELEYELGVALRNPIGHTNLYTRSQIEWRAKRFAATCRLSSERLLAWAGAQAILSTIWTVEDGGALKESDPALQVAIALGIWDA